MSLHRVLRGRLPPRGALQLRVHLAAAAAVVLGVLVLAGWMIADARRVMWDHALQSSENILGALEHDIQRTIETYDLSLQAVIEGLSLPDIWTVRPELRQRILFDRAADARNFGSILVLDRTGDVILSSRQTEADRANLADLECFTVHRDRPDVGLFVVGPVRSKVSGDWSVALSRRFEDRDGKFAGVVIGTLKLTLFRQLFDSVDVGSAGIISLVRNDGVLVVRKPYVEQDIGRDLSNAGSLRSVTSAPVGHSEDVSVIDGTRRIFAYRRIGDLPFTLVVGTASDAALVEWRQKAVIFGAALLALVALAGLLGLRLVGELRRRGAAERAAVDSESRLAEKTAFLQATLDTMDQGLMFIAADRTVPVLNRRAVELLGLPPSLMARRLRFDEIIEHQFQSGEFAFTEETFRAWVRAGGVDGTRQIYERRRPNGTVLEIRTVPLDGGGGVRTYTDITRRKQSEAELAAAKHVAETAAAEAERARVVAEAASRSKSEFLANMSHELRTPLNAIIGFSEVIRDAVMGPVDARYRDYAQDIYQSGRHLLDLINDVLDLSKIEVGCLDLYEEPVELAGLISACEQIVRARARDAGLGLVVEVPPDLPVVRGDERRLKQIVLNLLSNAVKFTPAGGRVTVSAGMAGTGEMVIAVSDTGIGMKPEEVALALEPFRQIDSALNRRYEGTGLGLPLVQRLVALHGGVLAVDTAPGAGTTVSVTLPAERCIRDVA